MLDGLCVTSSALTMLTSMTKMNAGRLTPTPTPGVQARTRDLVSLGTRKNLKVSKIWHHVKKKAELLNKEIVL